MINLTAFLENVPSHLLVDLGSELIDVQSSYHVTTDTSLNKERGYVCIDLECFATTLPVALRDALDLLDDTGLSIYLLELGVN